MGSRLNLVSLRCVLILGVFSSTLSGDWELPHCAENSAFAKSFLTAENIVDFPSLLKFIRQKVLVTHSGSVDGIISVIKCMEVDFNKYVEEIAMLSLELRNIIAKSPSLRLVKYQAFLVRMIERCHIFQGQHVAAASAILVGSNALMNFSATYSSSDVAYVLTSAAEIKLRGGLESDPRPLFNLIRAAEYASARTVEMMPRVLLTRARIFERYPRHVPVESALRSYEDAATQALATGNTQIQAEAYFYLAAIHHRRGEPIWEWYATEGLRITSGTAILEESPAFLTFAPLLGPGWFVLAEPRTLEVQESGSSARRLKSIP